MPFIAESVRATLAGYKTQTRRIVKPQPANGCRYEINGARTHALHLSGQDAKTLFVPPTPRSVDHRLPSEHGVAGDRWWVREDFLGEYDGTCQIRYAADRRAREVAAAAFTAWEQRLVASGRRALGHHHWMFMPRWAARLELEIVSVDVQRLQEISEEDALAEGFVRGKATGRVALSPGGFHIGPVWPNARAAYRECWDELNGHRATWESNPYVWVYTYKLVEDATAGCAA